MDERMRLFDRYSNTLLVSLNNRISIRDMYGAHGGVVDCQDIVGPSISNSSRSESTAETMIAETEKPQKDIMDQPVAETEVRESKSYDRHVMVPFSHHSIRSRDCRHPLMLILYELKTLFAGFELKDALNPTVIHYQL
jgi:hypothetical protein